VQKLAELGLIHAGVPICSVAPNRMLSFDWKFFSNALQITNPISGNEIFEMTPEAFHQNFANTLSKEDAQSAYLATATHDSRNVLRDCMLETGHIDLKRNNVPLFFIGAEKDHIIPAKLCEKNAAAYEHSPGVAEYRQFPERSHFICGEAGWEEVASSVIDWLEYRVQMPPRTIEANSYIPA
jgi:pimeloyl-ACP methyl ester carboxylesterase